MFDKLSVVGAELLLETVNSIKEISPVPQDEEKATYAPPIRKENAKIDWSLKTEDILNLIRGSYSWPIAYTDSDIGRIKVYNAIKGNEKGKSGEVLSVSDNGLSVATADGSVLITLFQVESGKRMAPVDYFRGHKSIQNSFLK